MISRLSSIAPGLAERLEGQEPERLRVVAAKAAALAVLDTGMSAILSGGLVALRDGRFGNSADRAGVLRLVDELDAAAWDLQEQSENDAGSPEAYLSAFRRARAAAAVGFALDSDAVTAALESVYEAEAAVSDPEAVVAVAEAALAREA